MCVIKKSHKWDHSNHQAPPALGTCLTLLGHGQTAQHGTLSLNNYEVESLLNHLALMISMFLRHQSSYCNYCKLGQIRKA